MAGPARVAASRREPSGPAVALTPSASWLIRVSHTSGQCGCSGRRFQSLAAPVSAGTPGGSSMRVVEIVRLASGSWGAFPARWSARQAATSTFSTLMAWVGHASTHAGVRPSVRRGWHRSHFDTMRRSGWNTGTEYGQFHVQYWQPMQSSAWCATIPLGSFS